MIFSLERMNADLSSVPETLRSAGAERVVQEMIAELRRGDPADLVHVDADRRRPELVELMTTLRTGARELSDLLTRTRFATPRQARPIWAGGES